MLDTEAGPTYDVTFFGAMSSRRLINGNALSNTKFGIDGKFRSAVSTSYIPFSVLRSVIVIMVSGSLAKTPDPEIRSIEVFVCWLPFAKCAAKTKAAPVA